jgi:plasmid stabilization system protein ParE
MSGYVLSPRAQADLEEIWDYSVEIWGTDRAEHYVRKRPTNLSITHKIARCRGPLTFPNTRVI